MYCLFLYLFKRRNSDAWKKLSFLRVLGPCDAFKRLFQSQDETRQFLICPVTSAPSSYWNMIVRVPLADAVAVASMPATVDISCSPIAADRRATVRRSCETGERECQDNMDGRMWGWHARTEGIDGMGGGKKNRTEEGTSLES